jgi:diadenosine tetraphosphate (Ap4A) HIT family hydrolase
MTAMTPEITETIRKFGHPATLIGETEWWVALFRRKQATLGALVLAAKCPVTAFSALPGEAFADLGVATRAVETALKAFVAYEKINYLMLMMVDPNPHFHVLPRYSAPRLFGGVSLPDFGWPGPPLLDRAIELPKDAEAAAIDGLRTHFAKPS